MLFYAASQIEQRVSKKNHHYVHLTTENKKDLIWWKQTLNEFIFTPLSFILYPFGNIDLTIFTDGALSSTNKAGIGGYRTYTMQYFQTEFQAPQTTDINALEMSAILISLLIWKEALKNKKIHFRCDNQPVVGQLSRHHVKKGRNDDCISYINTNDNKIADKLSRETINTQFCTQHLLTTQTNCDNLNDFLCDIFKLNT